MTISVLSTIRRIPYYAQAVSSGANTAAAINSAIYAASRAAVAAGRGTKRAVRLTCGEDYLLESPIAMRAYSILDCNGANLIPTYGVVGDVDVPSNAVIIADGASALSVMNTTLTTSVVKNTSTVVVANAGTLVAGMYFLIQGRNVPGAPQDALNESDGINVVLSEICLALIVAGTTITTAWPLRQHHGSTNCTVQAYVPLIGAEVWSPRIFGSEDSVYTANGVFGRYCIDLTVDDVSMSGASRAAIDILGCREYRSREFKSLGTNNCWTQINSTIDMQISDYSGKQGVARVHPNGIPRYPILLRARCTDVDIDNIHLTSTACGMYVAGGEHIRLGSLDVTDVEITDAVYDRMVVGGEIQDTGIMPLAFGSGYGPLEIAEFGFDIQIGGIRCEDLRAPFTSEWLGTGSGPCRAIAIYLHDILASQIGNLTANNRGDGSNAVSGIQMSDFGGHIQSIHVNGYGQGLMFQNVASGIVVDRYYFSGTRGNSPNASIPFWMNQGAITGHTIHFREVWLSNAFSAVRFGADFAGDPNFRIDYLMNDGVENTDVFLGKNESATNFAEGDVVEIDSTHTSNDFTRIIEPITGDAAHERRLAAVVTGVTYDYGTGYMFITALPPARIATVKATTAIVNKGAVMEYSGTRRCAPDAAAAHPIGSSLTYKASGSEGLIKVTRING